MMFLKAFIVGGLICVAGQLLIDLTKLTPARILVSFVCLGVLCSARSAFMISLLILQARVQRCHSPALEIRLQTELRIPSANPVFGCDYGRIVGLLCRCNSCFAVCSFGFRFYSLKR